MKIGPICIYKVTGSKRLQTPQNLTGMIQSLVVADMIVTWQLVTKKLQIHKILFDNSSPF